MGWNNLTILKLQRCNHPTLHNWCNYLSMLGLKLISVSKRGPWSYISFAPTHWYENYNFVCLVPMFWYVNVKGMYLEIRCLCVIYVLHKKQQYTCYHWPSVFFFFFVNWIGVALSNNISTWTSLRLGLVQYMFFLCQKFWLTPSINQSVNQLLTHQSISCFFDCNNITFLHVMVIKNF